MTKVGIMGGGQLGRMLALSGYPLGLSFRFFDPNPLSPAGQIGELISAPYDDSDALDRFASDLDVVTYEFESVPISAVERVAARVPVQPPPRALAAAQDRLSERELLTRLHVPVAPFAPADSLSELRAAAADVGYPAVIKTRVLGYDGKGQALVHSHDDLAGAWRAVGERPSIIERVVQFTRELSILAVRGSDGSFASYPLIENEHSEGILRLSLAPAEATAELTMEAERIARRVAEALEYVGLLAIELFDAGGRLLANEIAPRVHNSGHWTMEGAETSQFENHLRAILDLPLGSTSPRGASAMVNIIGAIPPLERLLSVPTAHVHFYGKRATARRKLGHVTLCAADPALVRELADEVRRLLV